MTIEIEGVAVEVGHQWQNGPLRCKSFHRARGPHTCRDCGRAIQVGEVYVRCHMMKGFKEIICTDHVSMSRQIAFEERWRKAQHGSFTAIEPHALRDGRIAFEVFRVEKDKRADTGIWVLGVCDYTDGTLALGLATVRALLWLTDALKTGVVDAEAMVVVCAPDIALLRRLETGTTYGDNEALWSQLRDLVALHTDRLLIRFYPYSKPKSEAAAPEPSSAAPGSRPQGPEMRA